MADGRVAVKVWDGWIRLVHWGIVALFAFSWWSAWTYRMDWHLRSGLAMLALLLFRLAWGVLCGQRRRGIGAADVFRGAARRARGSPRAPTWRSTPPRNVSRAC